MKVQTVNVWGLVQVVSCQVNKKKRKKQLPKTQKVLSLFYIERTWVLLQVFFSLPAVNITQLNSRLNDKSG